MPLGSRAKQYCGVSEYNTVLFPLLCVQVSLGPKGVEEIHEIGPVTKYEQELIDKSIPELKASIDAGIKFVAEN